MRRTNTASARRMNGAARRMNDKGAVLAEFAIAFMPICTLFLVLMQFGRYQVARVASHHAASVAARACAVIKEPNPGGADINGPESDVEKAVKIAMKTFEGSEIHTASVTCDHSGDEYGMDTATVEVEYTCQVPVARQIICPSGSITLTQKAKMGHQGARYKLE